MIDWNQIQFIFPHYRGLARRTSEYITYMIPCRVFETLENNGRYRCVRFDRVLDIEVAVELAGNSVRKLPASCRVRGCVFY